MGNSQYSSRIHDRKLTFHPLSVEDFEVSLFLTETNTRHSLLFKHRRARDKTQTRLVSNSSKLTGGTSDAPIDVEDGASGDLRVEIDADNNGENDDGDEDIVLTAASVGGVNPQPNRDEAPPNLLLEDSDEEVSFALQDIPDIQEKDDATEDASTRRSKRRRQDPVQVRDSDDEDEDGAGSDNDSLFMSGNENDNNDTDAPPSKRSRVVPVDAVMDDDDEGSRKKKKLAMDVIYEGFAIYGRVLCLVVKRRGPPRGRGAQTTLPVSVSGGRTGNTATAPEPIKPGGQAAMENWIASTQVQIPQTE